MKTLTIKVTLYLFDLIFVHFKIIRNYLLFNLTLSLIMSIIQIQVFSTGGHMVKKKEEDVYYLVRADILPEAIIKTIEAKKILQNHEVDTVNEAVEKVGLSRSAYYKYKDGIFPFNAMMKEKIVTISMNLEHQSGLLSKVLSAIAVTGGNILTINQTIPLQDFANIVASLDTANMEKGVSELIDMLEEMEGVRKVQIVGRG